MPSSGVMFARFRKWKKDETLLSVTCSPHDKNSSRESHRTASVFFVDERESTVAIALESRPHDSFVLDLSGATFTLSADECSLDVEVSTGDRWLFVEQYLS